MWYYNIGYMIAGAFFANGCPHFINGLSGNYWPKRSRTVAWVNEPTPKTKGLTSPVANVIWGWVNLSIAFLLLAGIGDFQFGLTGQMLSFSLGTLAAGIFLAWNFTTHDQ